MRAYVGETKHPNYNLPAITKHEKDETIEKNMTTNFKVIIEHNSNEQLNLTLRKIKEI